jgi:hypothetical protein
MKSHGLDPDEAHREFLQQQAAGMMAELERMSPEEREAFLRSLDPQLRAEIERQLKGKARGNDTSALGAELAGLSQAERAKALGQMSPEDRHMAEVRYPAAAFGG